MSVTTTLTDQEFRDLVRDLMGQLDSSIIPDDTIDEHKKRFAIPKLEQRDIDGSSDAIDTALAAYTAERSFKSWLKKQRIGGGGEALSVSLDVDAMEQDLEEQTQEAMSQIGITWQTKEGPAPFVENSEGWYDL